MKEQAFIFHLISYNIGKGQGTVVPPICCMMDNDYILSNLARLIFNYLIKDRPHTEINTRVKVWMRIHNI